MQPVPARQRQDQWQREWHVAAPSRETRPVGPPDSNITRINAPASAPHVQVTASWKKPTSHPEDIVAVYVAPVSATFTMVQYIKRKNATELEGSAT